VLLFASMVVNFVDRLVLASVAPILRSELHLSNTQYSYIVFAFMAGMTIGQLPAGMFVDAIGARLALPGLLSGWSVSNMLQSLARGVGGFSSLRFLMGLCECGNYSAGLKVIGGLFPARQRALALGIFDSGSLAGSVLAPPFIVFVILHFGWRAAFWLPSALGLLWIALWLPVYRRRTRPAPQDTASSTSITVRDLLARRQTWGVILMRALSGPISQFYWYWLPLYLVRGRGMSLEAMATFASVAYLIGGAGQIIGGTLSGSLISHGISVDASRKFAFTLGCVLNLFSMAVPLIPSPRVASYLVGVAIFGLSFMGCNLIAVITDVFPEQTLARVTGLTGIGEGVLNMGLTVATGVVVDRFSFGPVFAWAAVMPALSVAALFLLVRRCSRIGFPTAGSARTA
jgi:ACS family hexuronate transporter-like MFS transporter